MKTVFFVIAVAAPWIAGCAATAPQWESRFGDAARQAVAAQVLDPNAPSRNTGLAAIDGKAVAGAQKAYATSYGYAVKEAAPAPLLGPAAGSGR
jgi:hypothetical protein